ncbi:RagB/SusD family nutrient uptake outer membrane protein [Sphingobacterium sp. SGR-19]|uniref:RagB/SusD family nutrient uptake outer membrane protein n=1 Tax=Sphingobacterium sp. SGR-19 TaxID=2710886 RepID=UPI0013EA0300|nr:RagB/SusD family nutrient uptake outer membrane protein [Sphingobacterium sp. SGR-19]NGM64115.1 hypothetical protein [Sphingobacterium sp. SGR-19]
MIFKFNEIRNGIMNRIAHRKLGAFLTVVVMTCTACEDYLTVAEVENRTVSTGYYDSPQKVEQAVIGVYVDLRRALLQNYAWLMYGEGRTGDLTLDVEYMGHIAEQHLADNDRQVRQLTDWGYFYDAINDANHILDKLEKTETPALSSYQYELYKGEALALKSMAYFYLTRIWDKVPSAETSDRGTLLTQVEVLTRASQWAKEAKELLPWQLVNDDGIVSTALTEVRFNKTAVSLLLAHQQLWLGKGQEAYKDLTQVFEGQSPDSLSHFGLSLGKDMGLNVPSDPYTDHNIHMSEEKFGSVYPGGDTRRSMFNVSADGATASLIIEKRDMLMIYAKQEIQLLFAEAAWRSEQLEKAKEHLMAAATGATEDYTLLTSDTFGAALLLERQRMLMGSGQRFFDLIRFNKIRQFVPFYTEGDLAAGAAYWPLSAQSITSNGLEQNGYWAKYRIK